MNHYGVIREIAKYALNYWKQIRIVEINAFSGIHYFNT